jgi:methylated-DNA-protein-cysteine methyltransferase related protein
VTPGSRWARIYAAVRRIPKGRVATYGQIAALAGLPRQARQVGYALAALRGLNVPWHRVINARGEISPRSNPGPEQLQRVLLEREGVRFDAHGRVALAQHRWRPRARAGRRRLG